MKVVNAADELVRRALEVAFVVAVKGAQARPPVPPPAALKPYLRLQKLPAAALGPVRRTVEGDRAFRLRVADVATEEFVGRAGWLWLHRPDGWEGEFATLAEAAEASEAAEHEGRQERTARKRLEVAEQASARAAAEAAAARREAEAARAEAEIERRERRAGDEARQRLERRVAQLDVELGGARRRLAEAEAAVVEATTRAEAADVDVAAARLRIAELSAGLAAAEASMRAVAVAREALGSRTPAVELEQPVDDVVTEGPLDRDRLSVILERAASATAALAEALGDAAALVEPPPPPEAPPCDEPGASKGARRRSRPARPRRTPVSLPGGIMGDSVSAAEHLVKADRVVLLVDGYNAAKLAWPGEPLPEQRARLLDLVDELIMRHGTETTVVFDGAELAGPPAPVRRRLARVSFSPADRPADDVIVDLVRTLPSERPVVVATNDRAVRAAARSGGANVISSEQLLAVARR